MSANNLRLVADAIRDGASIESVAMVGRVTEAELAAIVRTISTAAPSLLAAADAFEQRELERREAHAAMLKQQRDAELMAAQERNAEKQRTPEAIDARLQRLEAANGGRRKLA